MTANPEYAAYVINLQNDDASPFQPKSDEEEAKKKLTSGEATHEEVVTVDGKRYLRKATPVPVVLERCVMCRANFKDNDGIIGTLAYTVPLIE